MKLSSTRSKPSSIKNPPAPRTQTNSAPRSDRPIRLSYQTIMECGIIWALALILAVGGLLFTQATLDASGIDGEVAAGAVPGDSDSLQAPDIDTSPNATGDSHTSDGNRDSSSPTYDNQVGDRQLPIYCVETDKKVVVLSFDAAWGNEDTMILMDILAKYNVKVTFFMTGGWVNKFPEDVQYIAEQGHDLGNHSLSHKEMSKLSEAEIREELQAVHDKVKELTGIEMDLFRPPYGDYDDEVITTAQDIGYFTIQWDVDSLDWKDYGAASIVKTVCNHKNLKNGSIILMHNGAKYTPEALESVIQGLLAQGYEIVPISELIIRDSYHLDHTGMQIADN